MLQTSGADPVNVEILVDEEKYQIEISGGASVEEAIEKAGVSLSTLDKSDPPLYSVVQNGDTISITRVEEEYVVEQEIIPYDTQTLRNESLAEGEQRLIQPGENGLEEITYRVLFENGVEVSRTISSRVVVSSGIPEIMMVGSQTPFSVIPVPGILAYISAGNAWVMRENTGVRQPVVTTGDLDGRIFKLSPNGRWLLYTRSGDEEDQVNTLWVTRIDGEAQSSFDLGVANVIHFADWIPGTQTGIVYSSAEANPGSPGWQANNDLVYLNFSEESGWTSSPRTSIEPNSGGLYGWWGMTYQFTTDGENMAFSRPDGIGVVDLEDDVLSPIYDILPLQTRSDWAWVPPIAWSPDEQFLYFIDHIERDSGVVGEDADQFDLAVYPFGGGGPVSILPDVGMFALPKVSPQKGIASGEVTYYVAFLQATNPRKSRTSTYDLMVMDRDGSNVEKIFPQEGNQGLSPHQYYWLPWYAVEDYPLYLTFIYQGNLWLVDAESLEAQQLTGDGLVTAIDWN